MSHCDCSAYPVQVAQEPDLQLYGRSRPCSSAQQHMRTSVLHGTWPNMVHHVSYWPQMVNAMNNLQHPTGKCPRRTPSLVCCHQALKRRSHKYERDSHVEDDLAASTGDQGPGSQSNRVLTLPGDLECLDLQSKIIAVSMR